MCSGPLPVPLLRVIACDLSVWKIFLEANTKDLPVKIFLEANTKDLHVEIFLEANTKDLPIYNFS